MKMNNRTKDTGKVLMKESENSSERLKANLQNPEKFVRDDRLSDAEGEADEHATNDSDLEKDRLQSARSMPKTF
jgi:hypothetical protein